MSCRGLALIGWCSGGGQAAPAILSSLPTSFCRQNAFLFLRRSGISAQLRRFAGVSLGGFRFLRRRISPLAILAPVGALHVPLSGKSFGAPSPEVRAVTKAARAIARMRPGPDRRLAHAGYRGRQSAATGDAGHHASDALAKGTGSPVAAVLPPATVPQVLYLLEVTSFAAAQMCCRY